MNTKPTCPVNAAIPPARAPGTDPPRAYPQIREQVAAAARTVPGARVFHEKAWSVHSRLDVNPAAAKDHFAGLFASPARSYTSITRFSSSPQCPLPDKNGAVHGLGLKIKTEDAQHPSHNFTFIDTQTEPLNRPQDFANVTLASNNRAWWAPLGILQAVCSAEGYNPVASVRTMWTLVTKLARKSGSGFAGSRFDSVMPFAKDGKTPARYYLEPCPGNQTRLPDWSADNGLIDGLKAELQQHDLKYNLMAQSYVDEAQTPLNDLSRVWAGKDVTLTQVAQLVIPQQDPSGAASDTIQRIGNGATFTPGVFLPAHRPMGDMADARVDAYRGSYEPRIAWSEDVVWTALED